MAMKDYYLILGIPRDETLSGIRAAYRDLAKRHHPDVAGESGRERFMEIAEAYETLSDPDRRRRYNHLLGEAAKPPSMRIVRPSAEPLTAQPRSIFERPESIRPSADELLDRWMRNFSHVGARKGEREEGLNIEVVLTPEEAHRGGDFPIGVPVFQRCPACGGTGEDWLFPCFDCRGEGVVERQATVLARIPPMVQPGAVIELPLRGLGVHNFYLRLHILISEE